MLDMFHVLAFKKQVHIFQLKLLLIPTKCIYTLFCSHAVHDTHRIRSSFFLKKERLETSGKSWTCLSLAYTNGDMHKTFSLACQKTAPLVRPRVNESAYINAPRSPPLPTQKLEPSSPRGEQSSAITHTRAIGERTRPRESESRRL